MYGVTPLSENTPLFRALCKIEGISHHTSRVFLDELKIDQFKSWSMLTYEEKTLILEKLKNFSLDTLSPNTSTGHQIGTFVKSSTIQAIRTLIRKEGYKGLRHKLGKRCRGQRTQTSGRKNRQQKKFQKLQKQAKLNR